MRKIKTKSLAAFLALALTLCFFGCAKAPPSPAAVPSLARLAPRQPGFAKGAMTLEAVRPSELRAEVERILGADAGQTAGSYDYTVVTKLIFTLESELGAADWDFILDELTGLTSLDLSGHAADFAVGFEGCVSLLSVKLPQGAVLTDSMFSGCTRLKEVLFLGEEAPAVGNDAFSGVRPVAYVPDPAEGGYEQTAFAGHFSEVQATEAPVFSVQPKDLTVTVGQNAVFSVEVTGLPEPELQWQTSNDDGESWSDVEGQTGDSLSLRAVSYTQNGYQFRCTATSMAAVVNSDAAVLTVELIVDAQTPVITVQPEDLTVTVNDLVILSVTAEVTDGGALTYQWYGNVDDDNTGGTPVSGGTDPVYSPSTEEPGTFYYYAVVTNTNINATGDTVAAVASAVAQLTVNAPDPVDAQTPDITGQPNGMTVNLNASVTLNVAAGVTDGGALTYQWYRNASDKNTGGTRISGATSASYTPPTNRAQTVYYYAVVTNTNSGATGAKTASAASATARVKVNALINAQMPAIVNQPKGVAVKQKDGVTLSVKAEVNDKGALGYEWYKNDTNSNAKGERIDGATKASYEPPTDLTGIAYYYVVVTNTNDRATGDKTAAVASAAAAVVVYTTPGTPQKLTAALKEGQATLFWAAPVNDGGSAVTGYQTSKDGGANWTKTAAEYEHTFDGLEDGTEYTFMVRALNAAGNGEQTSLTVTTPAKEQVKVTGVTLDRLSLRIYAGQSATLRAIVSPADAGDTSVVWKSGDVAVATVDANGVVMAHTGGSAEITATTLDGGHSASCVVTVEQVAEPESGGDNLFAWLASGIFALSGLALGIYLWLIKKK